MANTEVGSAYVTIYPQTDGNFSKTVGKDLDRGSSGLSAKAVAIGNLMSNAITGAVTKGMEAIGSVVSGAFENYADYEQLVGGVETLFKDAGDVVQKNAKRAFETAGMSANEYMENVTSFSASLISSLEGDTEKAAEVADKAMVDMSDNANKMGTDMEAITNAYQGFAKQNYTMLDNLKLGYGGTKSEMERLLDDAGKIAGVKFDIDSYADVIEAIHVMQESMGITGTTMEEGATTISGSMNMLRGAWQNFLTAIGDGGRTIDLTQVTNDLVKSLGAVASNVIPAVVRIGSTLSQQLPSILSNALSSLPGTLDSFIKDSFGDGAEKSMQPFLDSVGNAVAFVQSAWPTIQEIIVTISEKTSEFISDMWPTISDIIGTVSQAVLSIVREVWPIVSRMLTNSMNAVRTITATVWPVVKNIINTAVVAIKGAIQGVSSVVGGVRTTFNGIKSAMTAPIEAARNTIKSVIDKVKGLFPLSIGKIFSNFQLPHISVNGGSPPFGIGGKGSLPSFSVNWYAKGGIVDGPTLIGVGEAGPEAIVPLSGEYMRPFARTIADELGGDARPNVYVGDIRVTPESELYALLMELGERMVEDRRRGGKAVA